MSGWSLCTLPAEPNRGHASCVHEAAAAATTTAAATATTAAAAQPGRARTARRQHERFLQVSRPIISSTSQFK